MASIFLMPDIFSLSDSSLLATALEWTNILEKFGEVEADDVYRWQEFVLTYGAACDVESDNWLEDTLRLSMDSSLKSEVLSDMEELSELQCGAISIFYLVTKRMVIRNQEAADAMLEWFNKFNILNYDNQNVSEAVLRIKAMVRAIGDKNLPKNAVRRILDGFSTATNEKFKDLVKAQSAMLSSSF